MHTRVTIIDDEPTVLHSLGLLLQKVGYEVHTHLDAQSFLNSTLTGDVIISDVRMPNMSGLELLQKLQSENRREPVIILTGHGDVDMAVTAMKLGAHDFIEKPYSKERVLQSISSALETKGQKLKDNKIDATLIDRYNVLTDRQKETMVFLIVGLSNKEIAQRLDISPRTVEIHRTLVMKRMQANSLADLVRMGLELKIL